MHLIKQPVEKPPFILFPTAGAVTFVHTDENCLLPDNLYVLPRYADVVTFSRQIEKSALAPDDDGAELSVFTADFHIAHTAEAVAVFGIDDLLIAKVRNTAVHKTHLITVYAQRIKNVTGSFLHFLTLLPKNFL